MSAQNTVDLSFNEQEFDASKKHIIDGFIEVYEASKKLGATAIPIGSTGGWTELNQKLKEQAAILKQLADANVKTAQAIANTAKATAAEATAAANSEKVKQQQIKTTAEQSKADTAADKAKQQSIRTKQQELTFEQALQREKDKGLKQSAAEVKIADQLANEYFQLNKALADAELRYKNLALTQGLEAEASKDALKEALSIRDVLDKVDGSLRNNQRNVGNYKSAFDGLGFSFTQIARELPSLSNGFNVFASAIGNNLPMVFDEVGKARKEIAALKEQGKDTPGLFDRITKSIFSTQVGLSILVTLFTVFGSRLVDGIANLFDSAAALEKYRERVNALIEAQGKLLDVQRGLRDAYKESITDTDRLENELKIANALGKSRGDILAIEEKIAKQKALAANQLFFSDGGFDKEAAALEELSKADLKYSDALRGTIALREKAEAERKRTGGLIFDDVGAADKAVEASEKSEAALEKQLNRARTRYEEIKKINKDNFDTDVEQKAKSLEIQRYNAEQRLLVETETNKNIAQANINAQQRILADERNFEDKRAAALRKSAASRKLLLKADLDAVEANPANRNSDGTFTAEAITARKKYNTEAAALDADLQVDLFNNSETFRKRRLTAENELAKAESDFAKARYQEISANDAENYTDRIDALGDFYAREQAAIAADQAFQIATKVMTGDELLALEGATQLKLKESAIKARKELADLFVGNLSDQISEAQVLDDLQLSKEQLKLYKSLKNKTEFAKKSAELDRKSQREQIENELNKDAIILGSTTITEKQKKDAQRRIYENQARLNRLDLEDAKKLDTDKQALKDIYYQIELKAVETFFSLATILADNYYKKRIEAIQQERVLLDSNYAKEVENIKNSTISEQEKAARLTTLQVQQAAKKQELTNRENAEKVKQAKLDKAITITRIITETALAVIHQLGTGDPVTAAARAILAGVTGAAQLAIAIATPLPSYAKGTDNHPGGPARYGEAGAELVQEPGLPDRIVSRETISMLKPGTKVAPLTSGRILAAAGGAMIANQTERELVAGNGHDDKLMRDLIDTVAYGNRATVAAMKKQKAPVIHIHNDSDFAAYIQKTVRS
jgi:hypothetical protein